MKKKIGRALLKLWLIFKYGKKAALQILKHLDEIEDLTKLMDIAMDIGKAYEKADKGNKARKAFEKAALAKKRIKELEDAIRKLKKK